MKFKFLFPLLLSALSQAQAAPAGTLLINQASASYQVGGQPATVNSGAAQVAVNAVCAVRVTPDGSAQAPGQQASAQPGQAVTFTYAVQNTGNASNTYDLRALTEAGSAFTPALSLRQDLNGNGQAEAGEPEVSRLTLDAGASATVLLLATAPASTSGGAGLVNLSASCAGGGASDTNSDTNNVARLNVTPPPALSVSKAFGQERLRPGEQTRVTVRVANEGTAEAREVSLTDPLADQVSAGLQYVPGSARSGAGTLEFSDGQTWTTGEPARVLGVRVQVGTLAAGAAFDLTFDVQARPEAENRTFQNVAELRSMNTTQQAGDDLLVAYLPGVALGPVGQAQAPEGSPSDAQSRPVAVVGQRVCFDHTLLNTGDVSDAFTVTVTLPSGQATATLLDAQDQPLAQPVVLGAGASSTVRACYVPLAGTPRLEATLTARGARGTANATRDLIDRVEAVYPTLQKTVTRPEVPGWTPDQAVMSGDTLTYTLSVTNPYARPLDGLTLRDPLPRYLTVVDAGGAQVSGPADAPVLTWNVGTLAPGETRRFRVVARVSNAAPDDERLRNVFTMTSTDFPQPVDSPAATAAVWNAAPFIAKAVSAAQVTPGDTPSFTLTLKNTSPSAALVNVQVTDTPPVTTAYVPGSSQLDGQPLPDPVQEGGTLRWTVPRLAAGQGARLTYRLRVLPGATGTLTNTALMVARTEKAQVTTAISNRAAASTRVNLMNFAPLGDLLGTVFLDRDGNGLLGSGDSGVAGARVLLAGGRLTLTDAQGRYHFADVPLGTHALRLDPRSVSAAAQGGGTATVVVTGLTSVDFPLSPTGAVTALRDVEVQLGSLTVRKTLSATPTGYRVTLTLSTPQALPLIDLTDPLPGDARLLSGQRSFQGPLAAGTTTLTYAFDWLGDPASAVTDPLIRLGGQP